jgi:hypothetical protein
MSTSAAASPPRAFVTYNALPAPTPPHEKSSLGGAQPPAPVAAAPPAAITPATPHQPAAAPVPEPRPSVPPLPPAPKVTAPARERWSDGRIVAIAVTAVLIVGSLVAALVLSGGSDTPKPPTAKAARGAPVSAPPKAKRRASKPAPAADLKRQVQTLDDLMKTSGEGRAAAVKGQTKAAIANRSKLLKDLQSLRTGATDARLKAGLRDFTAAIRESLRQNRECADKCSTAELNKVNRLKQQAVTELNPLLRKYTKTTYRSQDI